MSMRTAWRESKHVDKEKNRGGGSRRFGARHAFTPEPVRIHLARPEELYEHPDTGSSFPFYTGERFWVPKGGASRNGCYVESWDECIINAYKNPSQFGLNIQPIGWMQKLNPKIYYAVSGWVEENFHNVKKKSEKSGNEYHQREICTGRGCENCQEGWPKVFGKKAYFIVAPTHWNESIYSANEQVESSCKCGGFVYAQHYECGECSEMLVDMMNFCFNCESENIELDTDEAKAVCADCQSEWSVYESDNKEVSKVVNSEMKCPKCQHKGLPRPVLVCTDCEKPDPYDIFDCQLKIKMVGSKDGKSKDLVIDDIRIQEPDERLFDKKFQGDDPEWNQKIADGMKNPINLTKQLAHLSQDEEAALLRVANPFTAQESRGFKQYSKPADEEVEADTSEAEEEAEEVVRHPPKGPSIAKGKGNKPGIRRPVARR
jgi:hypothetical protein